jgi:hypothetical protein
MRPSNEPRNLAVEQRVTTSRVRKPTRKRLTLRAGETYSTIWKVVEMNPAES